MKEKRYNLLIFASALIIVLIQIMISLNTGGFTGTDDQAVATIQEIAPNYEPWASNLLEYNRDWIETTLFALQAVLGLGIILFYILKNQNKKTAK